MFKISWRKTSGADFKVDGGRADDSTYDPAPHS
jgi:hypothetical protein